ncbi:arginine--tRNA ligase, partial [Bacteroidota bacterium]
MNIEEVLKQGIQQAFKEIFKTEILADDIKIQPTNKEFEGSHTFVIFPFLKITRRNPVDSGNIIGDYLHDKLEIIKKFNVVKGFLNLTIDDKAWIKVFDSILQDKEWGISHYKDRK